MPVFVQTDRERNGRDVQLSVRIEDGFEIGSTAEWLSQLLRAAFPDGGVHLSVTGSPGSGKVNLTDAVVDILKRGGDTARRSCVLNPGCDPDVRGDADARVVLWVDDGP